VDEAGLGEDSREAVRGGDREAAHLDDHRLPGLVGERLEEVVEQGPRGSRQVVAMARLEALDRGVEALRAHNRVQAADPSAATEGAPARLDVGAVADPDPVPPVTAQLAQEVVDARPAHDHVGEPLRVAVKPALDRHAVEARVAVEQVAEDVGAAAAGAADEDQVRGTCGLGAHLASRS
jgi:hypothetical protein